LGPMDEQGELAPLLENAFAGKAQPADVIKLH